jgi:diguanylate cyclase (GGDEF)-like protein
MPARRPRGAESAGAPRAASGPCRDEIERAAPSIRTPFAARVQLALQAGGAAAVVGYCLTAGPQTFARNGYIVILLLIGETLAAAFPITVNRPPAGRDRARGATDHTGIRASLRIRFTGDGVVVVACALLLPTRVGTMVLVIGTLIAEAIRREKTLRALEQVSVVTLCSFLALGVAHMIGPVGLSALTVAGAVVACFLGEISNLSLGGLMSTLEGRAKFWAFLREELRVTAWPLAWLAPLGVLVGAVGSAIPWALPLMAAPLALIFLASRARVDATEDRARLDGLLKAATVILEASTVATVTAAATASAADLFGGQDARIGSDQAQQGELGVPLLTESLGTRNLVVGHRATMVHRYTDQDQRLLEALASITASALEKAALHEDATEQASHDALTGLANRRSFEEQLRLTVEGVRGSDGAGVVFVDLDGFKQINDRYGHQAGDEALVEAAKRLAGAMRDGDTVARLGGDEFTILLRGVCTRDEVARVADRVLASMRRLIVLSDGAKVRATPSIGIAMAGRSGMDPEQLLQAADEAMYEAKRAGKDCWRLAGDAAWAVV